MCNLPILTIVLPVHNSEKTLTETIESIEKQVFVDYEVLCVDDGSTDGSSSILREASRKDRRFNVIQQECQGAAAARNLGLKHAKGKYLIFLDSDDLFDSEMFSCMVEALDASGAEICMCESDQFSGEYIPNATKPHYKFPESLCEGLHFRNEYSKCLFQLGNQMPWNKMYVTDIVKESKATFQSTRVHNDVFFTSSIAAVSTSVYIVKRPFVHYRVNLGTSLQDSKMKYPYCSLEAAEKMYECISVLVSNNEHELFSLRLKCIGLLLLSVKNSVNAMSYSDAYHKRVRVDLDSWDISTTELVRKRAFREAFLVNAIRRSSPNGISWALKTGYTNRMNRKRAEKVLIAARMIYASVRGSGIAKKSCCGKNGNDTKQ